MTRTLRMVIGCVLPLLLIFVLPLFGISGGVGLFVLIVLMFGCHLMMTGGHEAGHEEQPAGSQGEGHHESP